MFVYDFLAALFFAIIFSVILSAFMGWGAGARNSGWGVFLFSFLLLFLLIWAGGVWVTPFGPTVYDVSWVPFLFIGIIAALVIAAVSTPYSTRYPDRYRSDTSMTDQYSANYAEGVRMSDEPGATLDETRSGVSEDRTSDTTTTEEVVFTAFGVFFWFLAALLIIAIFARYWE